MLTQEKSQRQGAVLPRALRERLAIWEARSQATSADADTQRAHAPAPERYQEPDQLVSRERLEISRKENNEKKDKFYFFFFFFSLLASSAVNDLAGAHDSDRPRNAAWPFGIVPELDNTSIVLLEKYGDLQQLVVNHPLFQHAEDKWNIYHGRLISACQQYTPSKVLTAIKFTRQHARKTPWVYLFSVLEKGINPSLIRRNERY